HEKRKRQLLYRQALKEARRLPSYSQASTLPRIAKEMIDKTEQENTLLESLDVARHAYYNRFLTDSSRVGWLIGVVDTAVDTGHIKIGIDACSAMPDLYRKILATDTELKDDCATAMGKAIGQLGAMEEVLVVARRLQHPEPFIEIAFQITDRRSIKIILEEGRSFAEDPESFDADYRVLTLAAEETKDGNERYAAYGRALQAAQNALFSFGSLHEYAIDRIGEAVVCNRLTYQQGVALAEQISDRDGRTRWLDRISIQLGTNEEKINWLLLALESASKPLAEVVDLMRAFPAEVWYPAWLKFIETWPARNRYSVLFDISTLAPLMEGIGSDKTPDKIAMAIMDVCDWWP
ncbi:MAG: hypothetical protein NTU88_10675, partial [Armatimonadetes bacterium]|nr:hypothetical protein [Armatimonadota bacterium]